MNNYEYEYEPSFLEIDNEEAIISKFYNIKLRDLDKYCDELISNIKSIRDLTEEYRACEKLRYKRHFYDGETHQDG